MRIHTNKARTCEGHFFVHVAPGDAVAAVLADPGEVVPVLVRRGQLQDLGGLLEGRVQRLVPSKRRAEKGDIAERQARRRHTGHTGG